MYIVYSYYNGQTRNVNFMYNSSSRGSNGGGGETGKKIKQFSVTYKIQAHPDQEQTSVSPNPGNCLLPDIYSPIIRRYRHKSNACANTRRLAFGGNSVYWSFQNVFVLDSGHFQNSNSK